VAPRHTAITHPKIAGGALAHEHARLGAVDHLAQPRVGPRLHDDFESAAELGGVERVVERGGLVVEIQAPSVAPRPRSKRVIRPITPRRGSEHLGRGMVFAVLPAMRSTSLALLVSLSSLAIACGDADNDPSSSGGGGSSSTASGGTSAMGGGAAGGGGAGTGGSGAAGGSTPGPEGYQGFGAITEGHASCPNTPDEVHVTTLDDGGPGSLREALSAGCRRVVFDLGGTIVLGSDLNIPYSFITVDGATAPAPGITIEQPGSIGTTIEASNSIGPVSDIIITHLRMDGMAQDHLNAGDIWGLDGEANPVSRIVLDHLTGIAATDGVFDVWEQVSDVTLSYNLILDTVTALHLSTGDETLARERFSIHHNVFARNNERQIRIRHDNQLIDYVNNVIYGWGWMEAGAAGLDIHYDAGETNPSLNVIGNLFHHVAGTAGDGDDAIDFEQGPDVGNVYFADNVVPAGESDNVSSGDMLPIPAAAQVTIHAASELATAVVPHAGTHHPTTEEQALLDEIANDIAP
jgi:hypothetical protein